MIVPEDGDEPVESYREQFPVTNNYAYFQHPAVSALPRSTRETIHQLTDDMTENGCLNEREWNSRVEATRDRASRLLSVDPERVGFVTSTSHGLSWLAESLPLQPGDSVLVPDCEFPANQFPWRNLERNGVRFETIPAPGGTVRTSDVENALDERTSVLSLSSVQFQNGFRADLQSLAEIVREHDLYFIVDAIQSLGWDDITPDELPIDALVADGHKWLCGPEGAGIIYLDEAFQDELEPAMVGWYSVESPYSFDNPVFDLREDAGVVELGSRNTIGLVGLGASLELLLDVGLETIRERTFRLRDLLVERLLEQGFRCPSRDWERKHQSPIVSFFHPDTTLEGAVGHCRNDNVQITRRGDRLRAGVHFYNNQEDIDRLLESLRTFGDRQ